MRHALNHGFHSARPTAEILKGLIQRLIEKEAVSRQPQDVANVTDAKTTVAERLVALRRASTFPRCNLSIHTSVRHSVLENLQSVTSTSSAFFRVISFRFSAILFETVWYPANWCCMRFQHC